MNLLLLDPPDLLEEGRARVEGRRAEHVRKILRAAVGDELRVGRVDGELGRARITAIAPEAVELEITWTPEQDLPPASEVSLAVAMCRPPTLVKVLSQATAMGVKRFMLFHARRVEKSYWDAEATQPAAMREHMRLGLEQARDTRMPEIESYRRFRPFVEDELFRRPELGPVWVADPSGVADPPAGVGGPRIVVIGPEGGFVDFERERFAAMGARTFHMGPRILRVETAVVALLGRLAF